MLTTEQYEDASRQVSLDWDARTREQKAAEPLWRLYEEARVQKEWAEWLQGEYAPEFTDEAAQAIFDKAYEDFHSSGAQSVANGYEEIVEFIRKVNNLNR